MQRAGTWQELRQGWPVLVGCLVGATAAQFHAITLGLFIRPITEDVGWSNATITSGLLIASILAVPGAPFAGWLAGRFGVERIIMLGLPIFLAACAVLSVLSGSPVQWMIGWTIVALCSTLLKNNVWMLWTAQNFLGTRGVAFAIVMSGNGLFAAFLPYLVQLSIDHFGWRATYPVLAGSAALIAIPVCYLATRHSIAARTGEKGANEIHARQRRDARIGLSLIEAARLRHFWQILAATFLLGCAFTSFQIHLVPMLQARMSDIHAVAIIAGAFGIAALVGRFTAGVLLDRFPGHIVGAVSLILPVIGCILYLFAPMNAMLALAVAVSLGVGVGAEGDVMGYVTSRYFGTRSFGVIYGVMASAIALGAGVGPFALSVMHDRFKSYDSIMAVLLAGVILIILLIATLGRYPDQPEAAAEEETGEPPFAELKSA